MFDTFGTSDPLEFRRRVPQQKRKHTPHQADRYAAVVVPEPVPLHQMWRYGMSGMTQEATALLAAYGEAGWTHRWSSKNHLVVYSPDGKETHGIPPSIYGKTARQRMRALDKWRKEHPVRMERPVQTLDAVTLPEVVRREGVVSAKDKKVRVVKETLSNGSSRYVCANCGWIGQTYRSVAQHFAHVHARKGEEPETVDVPTAVPTVSNDDSAVLAQVRALLGVVPGAEVAQLKAENAALRSEIEAMRAEREALKDLLA